MSEKKKIGRPLSSKYSVELGFSFPKIIGSNLELWRYAVLNQDIDFCAIIDGGEGTGKSHIIQQIAYFMDVDSYEETGEFDPITQKPIRVPTGRALTVDQIVFTYDDLIKAIRELPPYKAIIYDEAGRSTDRRASTKDSNINFNQMMREARQFNKFIFFVIQSFYDMDMYAAVWRTRCLFHIQLDWKLGNDMSIEDLDKNHKLTPLIRGNCTFFTEKHKKNIYTNKFLRQSYSYPCPAKSFKCNFIYKWIVDHEEYKKKKHQAAVSLEKKSNDPLTDVPGAIDWLISNNWLKHGGVAAFTKGFLSISDRTFSRIRLNRRQKDPSRK